MLACRRTNSQTIALLAWAPRVDVFYDSGRNGRNAQGTDWYKTSGAWGFRKAGESKSCCCDTAAGENRLCWHVNGSSGGYRCGDTKGLGSDNGWEKLVFESG